MVSWVYAHVQTYQIICTKYMQFFWYLNHTSIKLGKNICNVKINEYKNQVEILELKNKIYEMKNLLTELQSNLTNGEGKKNPINFKTNQ